MRKYVDLIRHTFYFDGEDFAVQNGELYFHGVQIRPIVEQYGTPLRFTYLPKISQNIQKAKALFASAMQKVGYEGKYNYCYCTKSSHFSFVVEEAIKNQIGLETSSAFDLEIIMALHRKGLMDKNQIILHNGYKDPTYTAAIRQILHNGFQNSIPILDHTSEIEAYEGAPLTQIGLRLATDEEPHMQFYTSRLGIPLKELLAFYDQRLKNQSNIKLKLLHFFVNAGIKDTVHFWSELNKIVYTYCELRKICPDLSILDIGGGFPIKDSLGFQYDYEYMTDSIVKNIKQVCDEHNVPVPDIYTEFGSFTVGESGGIIFSVLEQKQQNDKELWYMLDGSLITHLPDVWGMNQKFIMLAVNNWESDYHHVHLGGRTCDSMDYYTSEKHIAKIMLPKTDSKQYIGFFNTGAYQESLGGYGGIQHCLIPAARHVIIDRDSQGEITHRLFRDQQNSAEMLKILGYGQ